MIGPLDRSKWYWTPTRLNALVATLKELAKQDAKGDYFGSEGLVQLIKHADWKNFGNTDVAGGIQILVYLRFLEEGKRGTKHRDYRRRFYPKALKRSIAWKDIEEYRIHRDQKRYSYRYK